MSVEKPKNFLKGLVIKEKLLMTANITNTNSRIRAAMTSPLLSPSDPQFQQLLRDIIEGIRYIFQTKNRYSFAISGPKCLAAETAVSNLLEENDKILVAVHGMSAEILAKSLKCLGHQMVRLRVGNPGEILEMKAIKSALETHKPKILFITHGDSTTGSLQPLRDIGALCHQNNCLLIVDASATVCCVPLASDKMEIDVIIAGTHYALGLSPGLSLMSFNERAAEVIKKVKTKTSHSMDFDLMIQSWGLSADQKFVQHYTPSVSLLYGLREALSLVVEEGLDRMIERHMKFSLIAQKEITKIGLRFLTEDEAKRLPSVLVITVPDTIRRDAITEYLIKYYDIAISTGISPIDKVWRIGILGPNANRSAVKLLTTVLREAIEKSKTGLQTKSSLSSPSTIG